jgi:isopenicillin N synthase-like dioxygenase
MGKSRKIAESYGLTIKEWFSLSDEEKIKLKSDNSEQVKDAAAKWGLTEEEYRAIPAPARRNLPRISETAQDNGYTWQEWLKLSNSEKQSIGKLQATAKKYGFNTKEYMSLNKNERVVIKQQISKAQKYGYSLTEWRTMSHKEQCKAAAINRARKAATQFEVSAEIWVELTSTQREKIRDRFKRGRRVPELLEDL